MNQILQLLWQITGFMNPWCNLFPDSCPWWSVWAASTANSALPTDSFFFPFWQASCLRPTQWAYSTQFLHKQKCVDSSIFRVFNFFHSYLSQAYHFLCLLCCFFSSPPPLNLSPECMLHLPSVPLSILLWILPAGKYFIRCQSYHWEACSHICIGHIFSQELQIVTISVSITDDERGFAQAVCWHVILLSSLVSLLWFLTPPTDVGERGKRGDMT